MTADRVALGTTDLTVYPLSLGGNVFGWTADRDATFAVLDAYADAGGNFVDTADSYSAWVPGNTGGDSERLIGEWLTSRSRHHDVLVATKVSQHPDFKGLAAANIRAAADASLERLQTDSLDLYYAHYDDTSVPLEETAAAFSELVDAGKIRHIGVSNYSAERIDDWLRIASENGLTAPVALQPKYNLVEREYEGALRTVAERGSLAVMPYYALAAGFLTGKYREGVSVDSPRAAGASQYVNEHGLAVVDALGEIAAAHGVSVASVAIAWLGAQPTITAPIASARSLDQLPALIAAVSLDLSPAELAALDAVSA
jgi:aryl-alcohol dehydrogenase-like predicted oxidoreductase